jgi:alpha-D-ribose 1-methylphosphonate 5-triphosphate synthase subunit PhnH
MVDEETVRTAFRGLLVARAHPGRPQRGMATSAREVLDVLVGAVWGDAPTPPLLVDDRDSAHVIEAAHRGTVAQPERGATIVRMVTVCPRSRVRLMGPGVDGCLETSLPMRPTELEARRRACEGYPLGVDLVFLEADGGITALPRAVRALPV